MKSIKSLYLLLGISFVTQATTSLVGGLIGIGPFTETENMPAAMNSIAGNINGVYVGVFLQIITALVIIVLGAALYQAGSHVSKSVAIVAMSFYLVEAMLLIIDQIMIFSIAEISYQFINTDETALINIAKLLFVSKDFGSAISMIPFGFGAILFYCLIMKARVIPKWLAVWGLITVPFVLVGSLLEALGVPVPFMLYIPYTPWEWVAGIYIFVKGLSNKSFSKT
ncbi:MAG: DUF4386 domain-containing protein [Treponema sp.]|jgi:hypothetical protein|nr:DUF4386 domain-containing protein [Treponema sp.]